MITRGQVRSSGPSLVADRDTMALCQGPRTSKGPRASKRPRRPVADCCKKRNHAPCMIFHCFLEHLAVSNTAQDLRYTDGENVGPDLHSLNCTEFGQLLLRNVIKTVATRCQILRLICTKFDFGWGSAPDPAGGAYSTPQTH